MLFVVDVHGDALDAARLGGSGVLDGVAHGGVGGALVVDVEPGGHLHYFLLSGLELGFVDARGTE